jgi:hypothetical protein
VFVKSLGAADVTMDKEHMALAINLVVSLHKADRCREARRICRATLALYEDVGADWGRFGQLRALNAVLDIELGNLREGLRSLHDTYPNLPEALQRAFSGKLVETMLLSGLAPLTYAGAIGLDSTSKATALVRFAGLVEDAEAIRTLWQKYHGDEKHGLAEDSIFEVYARVLAGKDTVAAFEKAVAAERGRIAVRPTQEFAYAACACQLHRLKGDEKAARRHFDDAAQRLAALDPQVSPQMLALSLHWANALKLFAGTAKAKDAKEIRDRAGAFFKESFDKGYGAFARYL